MSTFKHQRVATLDEYDKLPKGAPVNFNSTKKQDVEYVLLQPMPKEPEKSRTTKRGINHKTPVFTYICAWISLIFWPCFFLFFFIVPLLLVFNAPHIYLIISLSTMVALLGLFFIVATRSRCSVCKHSIFSPKEFTRNHRAHLIPWLGYICSTALHIILFMWFRCPACGTSQRISHSEQANIDEILERKAPRGKRQPAKQSLPPIKRDQA